MKKFATEREIIRLIEKNFSYTEIQARLSVSSSRISLIKKKIEIEKMKAAEEEAKIMIKDLEEQAKKWRKTS